MKNKKDKELADLQKKWYSKLKDSGFDDIETKSGGLRRGIHFERFSDLQKESIQEYYRLCSHFLNEHTFDSDLDKSIWEMHSEGQSVRQIETSLNSTLKKSAIWNIVKRLESIMKERYVKCKASNPSTT